MSGGLAVSESPDTSTSPRPASTSVSFDRDLIRKRAIWNPDEVVVAGRCALCSAGGYRTVATRQDGLPIQECASCGLAYVDPRPSSKQLADYYGGGYFSGEKDFFKGKDYCLERDHAIRDQAITGYKEITSNFNVEDKVILDIGCASGALLYLLREDGAREVIGIDSAEYPISFGKSQYGLDLRCETLESAGFPDEYFDLVTLIDVLEHVEDLNTFVTELRRVLKPAGNVFIITPNYLSHSFARDQWTCLHQDFEHLQYFSKQSLNALCGKIGLQMVRCWTDSLPFRMYEYPALHTYRLHQVVHPGIALRNGWTRMKYSLVSNAERAGLVMKAILSGPDAKLTQS